jgi:hypothetical protein
MVAENRITNIYGDVINRANKIKADTFKLVKSLENLIRKGYELAIVAHSLRQVYFAKNLDNLLVQLVCPTKNYISALILHLYYYITVSVLIPTT